MDVNRDKIPEFKGTKGEWKEDIGLDELSDNLFQIIIYSKEVTTHNIAHVFGTTVEESTKNAKLIAAAPELLEAIRKAMAISDLWTFKEEPLSEEFKDEYKVLEAMKREFEEVIKKAL